MRKIKFRAWDKREKKMWVPIIDQDGTPCAKHPLTGQLIRMDGDLLDPVMQYVDINDKHGKDIYEGDKLKYSIDGIEQEIYIVEDMTQLYIDMFDSDPYYQWDDDSLEIVGNIYEKEG